MNNPSTQKQEHINKRAITVCLAVIFWPLNMSRIVDIEDSIIEN